MGSNYRDRKAYQRLWFSVRGPENLTFCARRSSKPGTVGERINLERSKRPSYRQHHVNRLLPSQLRPSCCNPKRAENFTFFLSDALFSSVFGLVLTPTRQGHSPALVPHSRSALSRSERVRATISVFTLTGLRPLINATSANSIRF